jgi:Flp pilus assembly protein TadB
MTTLILTVLPFFLTFTIAAFTPKSLDTCTDAAEYEHHS